MMKAENIMFNDRDTKHLFVCKGVMLMTKIRISKFELFFISTGLTAAIDIFKKRFCIFNIFTTTTLIYKSKFMKKYKNELFSTYF